jgi:hypothetical protein
MDGSLQTARREGDPLRTARLLARSGEAARAFDLLLPLWGPADAALKGHVATELAGAFGALDREERLARAADFELLEQEGCAEAGRALERDLAPSRLIAGDSCRQLRAALYANACSRLPILLWGEHGTGHTLASRVLHALGGQSETSYRELYARSSRRRAEPELTALTEGGTLYLSYANEVDRWREWIPALCEERGVRLVIGMHTGVPQVLKLQGRPIISQGILPLRDRLGDLPALVYALLRRAGVEDLARAAPASALEDLADHDWPGNVRELANHVARAVRRAEGDESQIETHLLNDLYHGLPGEVGE